MIKGIKTKLLSHEGYHRLVIADPVQAQELAKQVPSYMAHLDLDGKEMVLANMTRNDFIHDRPNWQVQDWRIAPKTEVLSPWLCSSHHSDDFIPEKHYGTPELKAITDKLHGVVFGDPFESTGRTIRSMRWNNYRGVIMTQERFIPDETFGETHVWKYKEARAAIKDIREYWENFTGESIMEAKRPNPFYNECVSDIMMEIHTLGRDNDGNLST